MCNPHQIKWFQPFITAKQLATEITNFNVTKNNVQGEENITDEHVQNNKDVRALLGKSGIKPEELKVEEDIKSWHEESKHWIKK